jgi:hypothetical protein
LVSSLATLGGRALSMSLPCVRWNWFACGLPTPLSLATLLAVRSPLFFPSLSLRLFELSADILLVSPRRYRRELGICARVVLLGERNCCHGAFPCPTRKPCAFTPHLRVSLHSLTPLHVLQAYEITAFTTCLQMWPGAASVNPAVYITAILIFYFATNIWNTRWFGNAESADFPSPRQVSVLTLTLFSADLASHSSRSSSRSVSSSSPSSPWSAETPCTSSSSSSPFTHFFFTFLFSTLIHPSSQQVRVPLLARSWTLLDPLPGSQRRCWQIRRIPLRRSSFLFPLPSPSSPRSSLSRFTGSHLSSLHTDQECRLHHCWS